MDPTDKELEQITDTLSDYKELVENGKEDSLEDIDNSFELSLENGGKVWLHTHNNRTDYVVKIHIMQEGTVRDDPEGGVHRVRSQVYRHLDRELGFPLSGEYEPYTAFIGDDRITIKANFGYFVE